jgi:hypothetical protein
MTTMNSIRYFILCLILTFGCAGFGQSPVEMELMGSKIGTKESSVSYLGKNDRHIYLLSKREKAWDILDFERNSKTIQTYSPQLLSFGDEVYFISQYVAFSIESTVFVQLVNVHHERYGNSHSYIFEMDKKCKEEEIGNFHLLH